MANISRRTLMTWGAGTGLAAGLGAALGQRPARAATGDLFAGKNPRPARACILLYMAGGPSHLDTFDPKPGRKTGGPFRAIGSSSGAQISEHLPRMAAQMKHVALIRSLTAKEGNHDRARHLMHTSYSPAGGANHPAFGSLVAEAQGRRSGGMPGYVSINGPGESAGFLPATDSPFPVNNPLRPVRYLGRARGIDADRFEHRMALWRKLEEGYAAGRGGEFARGRRAVGEEAAALMKAQGLDAFRVQDQPAEVREGYGKNEFGGGCLMARRLVEAGVPFVEVTLNGWDTHEANFDRVKKLCPVLDQAMAALLADLEQRGLLSSTLVVWLGDFGRTPHINDKGGRDHFPECSSVLLAGGGIKGGQVVGATDGDGAEIRDRPVTVPDLYRTIAHVLDLNADKLRTAPSGRPLKAVDAGQVIAGLV
jgi:hypothetical protein